MNEYSGDALLAKKARKDYDRAVELVRGYDVTEDFLFLLGEKYLSDAMRADSVSVWVKTRISRFSDGLGAFLINGLCVRHSAAVPFESAEDGIIDVSVVLGKLNIVPLQQDARRFMSAWQKMEARRRAIEKSVAMPLAEWLRKVKLPGHMTLAYLSFTSPSDRAVFLSAYTSVPVDLKDALESVWKVSLFPSTEVSSGAPILGDDICLDTSLRKLIARPFIGSRAAYLAKRLLEHKNKKALRLHWKCKIDDVKQRAGGENLRWLWDLLWSFKSGDDFRAALAMCEPVVDDLECMVLARAFALGFNLGVPVDVAQAKSKVLAAVREKAALLDLKEVGHATGWQRQEAKYFETVGEVIASGRSAMSEREQLRILLYSMRREGAERSKNKKRKSS